MNDDRILLTPEQAISMLDPDAETIHTFINSGFVMIGAGHDREQLLEKIRTAKVREIGGPACCKTNHGLVLDGRLFVECRKDLDYTEFEKPVQE